MPHLSDRRALGLPAHTVPGVTAVGTAVAVAVVMAVVLVTAAAGASADPAPATHDPSGVRLMPRTTTLPFKAAPRTAGPGRSSRVTARAEVTGLPTWSSSFRYASEHKTYPYTMVGTDPAKDPVTTTVATTLTGVSFHFADRHVVAPSATLVRQVAATGLYTRQPFPGGRGLFSDVYMRTQFWTALQGGRKAWHVLLEPPARQPVLALTVPASKGGHVRTKTGATVYLVDVGWFDSQVQARVDQAAAAWLTQFLGGDVVLCGRYDPADLGSCGIGGYHSGATAADGAHTYVYASFLSPKIFGTTSGFHGLAPLSHEVAEWLTNPLLTNLTPAWHEPSAPQYSCGTALEVGDPLVGRVLAVTGSVYQDEAYLPYFSRMKRSTSWNQRYTWFASLTRYSRGCPPGSPASS